MKAVSFTCLVLLAMGFTLPSTLGQSEGPSLQETIDYLRTNTAPPQRGADSPSSDEINFHVDASGISANVFEPQRGAGMTSHYLMPMEEVQYATVTEEWAGISSTPNKNKGAITISCGERRGNCIFESGETGNGKSAHQYTKQWNHIELVLYDSIDRHDRLLSAATHMVALLAADYARTHPAQKDPFASPPQP
jgi:hypothetical protein